MDKPLYNKICIVGVGLIGGSIGMAIKKRSLSKSTVGVVRTYDKGDLAKKMGAVDHYETNISLGVKDADLVVLCTPVSKIVENIMEISKHIQPMTTVIDVGSTKSAIQNAASRYLTKNEFIGCHPMAGSEKTGVENAHPDLFENSVCYIAKDNSRIRDFWSELGAKTEVFDPESHDMWAAFSSHLPHIISFSLFEGFPITSIQTPNPSIREFYRLAKSDPELWADIIFSNKACILHALDFFKNNIIEWENAITQGKALEVIRFIRDANQRTVELLWKDPASLKSRNEAKKP